MATAKPLLTDLISGVDRVPSNYIRPISDSPNLQASSEGSIPLIDLQGLNGPNHSDVIKQIAQACQNDGFFQVKSHGIPEELIDGVLNMAREFFRLPESERMKMYCDDPSKTTRLSTSFNVKTEKTANWRDFLRLHCYPLQDYVNEWPSNPPSFCSRMEEFANWRNSTVALHKCIVSLVTILGFCLQLEFSNASTLARECSRTILMKLFVADISVYLGLVGLIIIQTDHSNRDLGELMNRISVFLGTLASILELLILFPPFGWFVLFFWSMYFVIAAIKSYQLSKTLCRRAVAALLLACGEFQVTMMIIINGRLMGSSPVAGLRRAYEKLNVLIKRSCCSTEHETTEHETKDQLPV